NEPSRRNRALRLIAETLFMAILPHALAALVLGNLRLASFFERAHSGFRIREPDSTIEYTALQLCSLRRDPAKIVIHCPARWSRCLQRLVRCVTWLYRGMPAIPV